MTTIDEIEALLARATPLPWRAGQWHPNTIAADGGWPVDTSCSGMEGGGCERIEDRDLIVALRNAAPDLIAVVRAAAKVADGLAVVGQDWSREKRVHETYDNATGRWVVVEACEVEMVQGLASMLAEALAKLGVGP